MPRTVGSMRSIERGLFLLELLTESPDGLRLKDIARATVLPESTTHRVLQTLASAGYVHRDEHQDIYRLTPKLYEMGRRGQRELALAVIADPYLKELQALTRETTHLAVLVGADVVTVAAALSEEKNLVVSPIGERHAIHASAVGKCIAAYADSEWVRSYIQSHDLVRFTGNTITDPHAFLTELAVVRKQGHARDMGEFEDDVRCVAAPVRNHSGLVVAAVGISGPRTRLTDKRMAEVTAAIVNAADRVSAASGAR